MNNGNSINSASTIDILICTKLLFSLPYNGTMKKSCPFSPYGQFTKWKREFYAKKVKYRTFQVHPGCKMHHSTLNLNEKKKLFLSIFIKIIVDNKPFPSLGAN